MSTKNIECQLAQGQIGRYLNGERFSTQAIRQLEAHVADCDECSELVTRRRQALLTMLGERNSNLAVVQTDASVPKPNLEGPSEPDMSVAQRLISAMGKMEAPREPSAPAAQAPTTATPLTKPQMFAQVMSSKPLLYGSALALVLIAMSYFSHGALKFFGPTVDETSPIEAARTLPVSRVGTAPTTVAPPKPSTRTPAAHPAPAGIAPSKPLATPASTPKTIVPRPAPVQDSLDQAEPKPTVHRHLAVHRSRHAPRLVVHRLRRNDVNIRVRHWVRRAVKPRAKRHHSSVRLTHQAHTAPSSGVRLYDPQGRPIQ